MNNEGLSLGTLKLCSIPKVILINVIPRRVKIGIMMEQFLY